MTAAERLENLGRLRPRLVRIARSRLRNPAQAEDAVQDAMLAAIESIDSFSGATSFANWLMGILRHKIVDRIRCSARDQWQQVDIDGTPLDCEGSLHADLDGPEQAMARKQLWDAMLRCVRDLPERTADTFLLREFVGMSTSETSRMLAVTESNCAVMLHRARARIRARLAPELSES